MKKTLEKLTEGGYELIDLDKVKIHQDKCWFKNEAMKAIKSDGIFVGYFIPKKYIS